MESIEILKIKQMLDCLHFHCAKFVTFEMRSNLFVAFESSKLGS